MSFHSSRKKRKSSVVPLFDMQRLENLAAIGEHWVLTRGLLIFLFIYLFIRKTNVTCNVIYYINMTLYIQKANYIVHRTYRLAQQVKYNLNKHKI